MMFRLHRAPRHNISTQPKVSGSIPDGMKEFFAIDLILLVALGPGVHSATNTNEYQKQKNNVSVG
jgi:hypothetical protein